MASQAIAHQSPARLPDLIRAAASKLSSATTPAEILMARESAGLAYDAARRAARLAKATTAHDDIVSSCRRVQADALNIECEADIRLADEIDVAQEAGEILKGRPSKENIKARLADLGVGRAQLHQARALRDAIATSPGALRIALSDLIEKGVEPTRSFLRREISKIRTRERSPGEVENQGLRLICGRQVGRITKFELHDLKRRAAVEFRLLELIENHISTAQPDARVGDLISDHLLAQMMASASEVDQ